MTDQVEKLNRALKLMQNLETITVGEKYDPAMVITHQEDADAYFEICVTHNLRLSEKGGEVQTRENAERIERSNLGYWAGYGDHETRRRVEELFRCAHPVFGKIEGRGAPTAEEALAAGIALGQEARG